MSDGQGAKIGSLEQRIFVGWDRMKIDAKKPSQPCRNKSSSTKDKYEQFSDLVVLVLASSQPQVNPLV